MRQDLKLAGSVMLLEQGLRLQPGLAVMPRQSSSKVRLCCTAVWLEMGWPVRRQ